MSEAERERIGDVLGGVTGTKWRAQNCMCRGGHDLWVTSVGGRYLEVSKYQDHLGDEYVVRMPDHGPPTSHKNLHAAIVNTKARVEALESEST